MFGDGSYHLGGSPQIDHESRVLAGAGLQLISTAQRQAWFEGSLGYRVTGYASDVGIEESSEALGIMRGTGFQVLADLFKIDVDGSLTGSELQLQAELEAGVSMRLPQGAIRFSYSVRRTDIDGVEPVNDSGSAIGFTVAF